MAKPKTTTEFVVKANKKHYNKYDYSETEYKKATKKVKIICSIHGLFEQTPNAHLNGQGCPKCGYSKLSNDRKSNTDQFIEKANNIHNNKYNYEKVDYINSWTKIIIICHEHGEFLQTPNNHLKGQNCPDCLKINSIIFIEKAKAIHGNKYDYYKVDYKDNKTKVVITCKEHGDFEQQPSNHLQGNGCPKCCDSKGELAIKAILDKHNIKYQQEYTLPEILSLLKYDFYLSEHNLLIEFHGKQHYEYIPFLHDNNEENFDKQRERDIFKKDHAYRFKYRFLEFNYKQLKCFSEKEFEKFVLDHIYTKGRKCQ